MSTDQEDSVTDEPDDAPRGPPPRMPAPSKLDQAFMARQRGNPSRPPALPKTRDVEHPPVDFSGAVVQSTPTSSGFDPLGFAREAIDATRNDWETIRNSAADFSIDSVTLAKLTKPVLDRAVKRLQEAERRAGERHAHQTAEVSAILRMKVSDQRGAEIRAYFNRHKSPFTTMITALNDTGDYETVSAILGAPAYLAGITNAQKAQFERMAELRLCPEGVKERQQAEKTRDLLKHMGERLERAVRPKLAVWAGESGALKALREAAGTN